MIGKQSVINWTWIGIFIMGSSNSCTPFQFGSGLLCVCPPIVRLLPAIQPDACGQAMLGPGVASLIGASAGNVRYFQFWYRDLSPPCATFPAFNLTNGVSVEFTP